MLANYDSMFRCRRHPAQPTEGICALCLKERLTRLACPCCGGLGSSRVAGINCKCSPLESASKPVDQDLLQTGDMRTIASLVQSDIETSKRLNHHKLNDGDDLGSRAFQLLRRAKSISLAKGSTKVIHDWESRSSRGSRRKTELNDAFDHQGKVEAEANGSAASHQESEKPKVSTEDGNATNADFISETQKHSLADRLEEDKPSYCNKGIIIEEGATADGMLQSEDASMQIHAAERVGSFPQPRLSKSKSTGWALNDGGWKGSPFWGRLINSETKKGKVKGFSIFKRSFSSKSSSIAFQREDNKLKDFNLVAKSTQGFSDHPPDSARITSKLRLPSAIQSRWAILRGRNSNAIKEVEGCRASKRRSPTMDCRALEVMGDHHFRCTVEESPSSEVRSISSLIFMDSQERLGLPSRKHFKVNYLGFNQLLKIK